MDDSMRQLADVARDLIRNLGGPQAAENFDEALEEYGVERAIQEALAGIGMGLMAQSIVRQARRGAEAGGPDPNDGQGYAPLVEEEEVTFTDGRSGLRLYVDVPNDQLTVTEAADDQAIMLEVPRGRYRHDLPFEPADWTRLSESGDAISEVAVARPELDFGADAEADE